MATARLSYLESFLISMVRTTNPERVTIIIMKIIIEEGKVLKDNDGYSVSSIIKNMLEQEYQFEIVTSAGCALVAFYKGDWQIQINNEDHIFVSDGMFIQHAKDRPLTLSEGFIKSRLEFHESAGHDARILPAKAIYDYLDFRLGIREQEEVFVYVKQAHRNGFIENNSIVC